MSACRPVPVTTSPVKVLRHRERTNACPKFVRKVRGARYQLRVYVGPTKADSWNFGLYETCEAAMEVRRRIFGDRRHPPLWKPGMGPLEALSAAKVAGVVPAGVLPRWVTRVKGGGYGAAVRRRGVKIDLKGPYPSPEVAYRAAVAALNGGG